MQKLYQFFKYLIRNIISRKLIFKYEPVLRKLYSVFYLGNKYRCLICNKNLRSFIKYNKNHLCPNCGSGCRERRLYQVLSERFLLKNAKILDFSPSRSYFRELKKNPSITYQATDISGNFIPDFKFDITNINSNDNSFDLIICYHVLEHIIDDKKAISELYRILKKNSYCLIQTPFKQGEIYEDYSIVSSEDRSKHFGQEDHVRIYSVNGLKDRFVSQGFKVEIKTFNEKQNNFYGFSNFENILICKK